MAMIGWFAPDILLACLFPLAVLTLCFRIFPSTSLSDIRDLISLKRPVKKSGPFSLQTAAKSYALYPTLARNELTRMRKSYSTLSRAHKRIGYGLGYPRKLDRLQDATDVNAVVTNAIAHLAQLEFDVELDGGSGDGSDASLGRVRESLKHFVRDWSKEGKVERDRMFKPILDVFKAVDVEERSGQKVLVPGCGLGRLAWEISELGNVYFLICFLWAELMQESTGYDTTANELSYFMTLAFRFLLSPMTKFADEHSVRPYAHWFSHQRTTDSVFRPIAFPDVVPRLSSTFHLIEQDFVTLTAPPTSTSELRGYHNVTTLFFIDTSVNVIETMEQIFALLRPGGTWINLGPLLWTGGAQAKVELSLEEVISLAQSIGFIFERETGGESSSKTVECEYTADSLAMMQWIYKAEFWVARKPK